MNSYIAFYKDRRIEVYAETSYAAQQEAVKRLTVRGKAPKSYDISVVLAEKDGVPVVYNGTEF